MRKTNLLQVDLCVGAHARLADEVDDPLLALIGGEVKTLGEVPAVTLAMPTSMRQLDAPNVNPSVYPAVRLANQPTRALHELVLELLQKEVVLDDLLRHGELIARLIEVKIDVEVFQEAGDGVAVLVLLRRDDLRQLAQRGFDA